MLSLPAQVAVFAYTQPVDFRKQHDGLYAIVKKELGRDPLDGSLFLFFNRRHDRIKLLIWDRNGFWLFYKRLEQGTFERLRGDASQSIQMTRAELSMLLDGIDLKKARSRRNFHPTLRINRRDGRRVEFDQRQAAGAS